MDQLNIRLDHSSHAAAASTVRVDPTLPLSGVPIPAELLPLCSWGHSDFAPGEYVGYCSSGYAADAPMVYAIVREELMSPDSYRVYLVDAGNGQDGVITTVEHLSKFIRK